LQFRGSWKHITN